MSNSRQHVWIVRILHMWKWSRHSHGMMHNTAWCLVLMGHNNERGNRQPILREWISFHMLARRTKPHATCHMLFHQTCFFPFHNNITTNPNKFVPSYIQYTSPNFSPPITEKLYPLVHQRLVYLSIIFIKHFIINVKKTKLHMNTFLKYNQISINWFSFPINLIMHSELIHVKILNEY